MVTEPGWPITSVIFYAIALRFHAVSTEPRSTAQHPMLSNVGIVIDARIQNVSQSAVARVGRSEERTAHTAPSQYTRNIDLGSLLATNGVIAPETTPDCD